MKKFYISNKSELNDYELRTGKVSYRRVIDRYIKDLVLCNNIEELDNLIYDNLVNDYEDIEIYQYYLCSLSSFEREILKDYGIILTYSNMLDLDVLCVDHFGTSWDYVMTDIEWTENLKEC